MRTEYRERRGLHSAPDGPSFSCPHRRPSQGKLASGQCRHPFWGCPLGFRATNGTGQRWRSMLGHPWHDPSSESALHKFQLTWGRGAGWSGCGLGYDRCPQESGLSIVPGLPGLCSWAALKGQEGKQRRREWRVWWWWGGGDWLLKSQARKQLLGGDTDNGLWLGPRLPALSQQTVPCSQSRSHLPDQVGPCLWRLAIILQPGMPSSVPHIPPAPGLSQEHTPLSCR